jgi:hypothetical protein
MKSGNLNFLEPSGPLEACKGTVYLYGLSERKNKGRVNEAQSKD